MAIETEANEITDQEIEEQPIIVVQDLYKVFQDGGEEIRAVDGVSFTCHPRQFVAITGPSGCGKSTLLYLLGSLERPTAGQLAIDGVDVTALEGRAVNQFRRNKIGFVFQSFHLVPNLSAIENVILPMEICGTPSASHRERARDLLIQVGIDENRHEHRPAKLSGGQQQRVAIARALANDPAVILADEPTGNVDSKNSKRIVTLLRELAHRGRTIVVVTHDLGIAKQADVHIELEDGQIVGIETH
jgi:ABC-type lipoprotein export system ATPase subunit